MLYGYSNLLFKLKQVPSMKKNSHLQMASPVSSISKITKKNMSSINHVLPPEILRKIFVFLDIKSLCSARQTCKYWNEIIVAFELVEEAASKITPNNLYVFMYFFNYKESLFNYRTHQLLDCFCCWQ